MNQKLVENTAYVVHVPSREYDVKHDKAIEEDRGGRHGEQALQVPEHCERKNDKNANS